MYNIRVTKEGIEIVRAIQSVSLLVMIYQVIELIGIAIEAMKAKNQPKVAYSVVKSQIKKVAKVNS